MHLRTAIAIVALIGAAMAVGPTAAAQAQAPFPLLGTFCQTGSGAGQCASPRGIASDPTSGHLFVVDEKNVRVNEFTAWGEFVKAWGWGVVASGPGHDPKNEVQQLTVNATGGTFQLRYGFNIAQTAPIPFDAAATTVQSSLEGAPSLGDSDPFLPGEVSVTGPTGGPWMLEFSGRYADSDFGSGYKLEALSGGLSGGASTATLTTTQQGGNYEVCVPAEGDICRRGSAGASVGQLGAAGGDGVTADYREAAQGIAVDSAGDLYVVDRANHRVQKYDSDGNFLLMFGGEVNKTTGADVCTKADLEGGDECGEGAFGSPGPGEGQFGAWGGVNAVKGDFIDIAPDDTIHVGDTGRIQKFAPDGSFVEQISGGPLSGKTMQSLALDDASGDIYVSFWGSTIGAVPDIHKLSPSGIETDLIEVDDPRGLAVDAEGNLFVSDKTGNATSEVLGFDSTGSVVDLEPDGSQLGIGKGVLNLPTAIETRSAPTCGLADTGLLVGSSHFSTADSFINMYGAAPDPDACPPPPVAPTIAAQFATAVDSGGATLRAKINPHFWADTRYYVEYGTGKCSDGGCDEEQPAAPGSLLTENVLDVEVTSAAVFLTGLEPGTTYHYRFVAQSGGGGPVAGEEKTLRTSLPSSETATCPNQAFRTGPAAKLPDCRAYELVSPLDKNNGEVAVGGGSLSQAAPSGERMAFSSSRGFADPGGVPLVGQYLASRGKEGWSTQSVSPPRSTISLYPLGATDSNYFKGFSEDLCNGWIVQDTTLALAPDAPEGVPNLYRRDLCADGPFQTLTTSAPAGFDLFYLETFYFPTIQGFSADAVRSVFRANAPLAVAEGGPRAPLSCAAEKPAGTFSYQWLRDGAPIGGATQPAYVPTPADDGRSLQCQVTDSDSAGASLISTEVALVEPAPVVAPPSPGLRSPSRLQLPGMATISGTPRAGETLTCTPGTWIGSPTFAYRWFRNATEIAGETASTYVSIPSDRGKSIQCRAIATNAGGSAVADSESTVIESTLPFNGTAPSISGTPSVGETLTCAPGTWSGSPSFTYQWLRGGANIAGATSPTYLLAAADEGKAVQCRVSAATSDATVATASPRLVVAPPPGTTPPDLTTQSSVSGEAEIGETLTCAPGAWSGSPTFAFRWLRNGANILGATTATYTLAAADLGKAVQCQVTATNAGGGVVAIAATEEQVVYPEPPLPPKAPEAVARGNFQLYLSDEHGELRLVSVLPDGSATTDHATAGTGWQLASSSSDSRSDRVQNAVSGDASRVFWTARSGGSFENSGEGPGDLYLRLNATEEQSAVSGGECTEAEKACTIPVSPSPLSSFISANPQGTRVIYATGAAGATSLGLFEATIEGEGGEAVASSAPIAGGVQGVMGTSDDASRVYFVSTEILTGGEENSVGDTALPGADNLYLYEEGEGLDFIGSLLSHDTQGGTAGSGAGSSPVPLSQAPKNRTARISPDGSHAAFTSVASLTGYDNADAVTGIPTTEVFLYDAEANGGAGELLCASCNPSGARPLGRLVFSGIAGTADDLHAAATLPGWSTQFQPSRALSEDGSRLFFNSYDSLVPGDSNGKADVYQWEAPGKGSCTEASPSFSEENGGCLGLISSGQSEEDSAFLDASADGADVFFATQSSLVPQDYGLRDVYDARVDGGFPPPVSPPPSCEGEACQGTTEAPNDPTPASQTFQGAGNTRSEEAKPRRCPKGKQRVKRRGETRCVKKRGGKAKRKASQSGRTDR